MKTTLLLMGVLVVLSGCSSIRHATNRNLFPDEEQAAAQEESDEQYREEKARLKAEARANKANSGSGFSTFLKVLGAAAALKQNNNNNNVNCRSNRIGNTVYTSCN